MSLKTIYTNMNHWAFWICLLFSICLIVGSFFVPPMGVVDGSILASVGELFGFATLATVIEAIKKGSDVTISHGSTTVGINNNDEK